MGRTLARGAASDILIAHSIMTFRWGVIADGDAEYRGAGVAMKWAKMGHHVKLVSATNGDIGHWQMAGGPLAQRRKKKKSWTLVRVVCAGTRTNVPTLWLTVRPNGAHHQWKEDPSM